MTEGGGKRKAPQARELFKGTMQMITADRVAAIFP